MVVPRSSAFLVKVAFMPTGIFTVTVVVFSADRGGRPMTTSPTVRSPSGNSPRSYASHQLPIIASVIS